MKCIDCDQNIPRARLKALPGVIRCVKCAEIYEKENGYIPMGIEDCCDIADLIDSVDQDFD